MSTSLGDRVRSLRLPQQQSSSGRAALIIPWVLCGLLALGCVALGYLAVNNYSAAAALAGSSENAKGSDGESSSPNQGEPAATGTFALESKGYIIPAHRILVSPKVSGLMLKLNIEEGQIVAKDEVLGEIEDVEYRRDWERAKHAREAAEWRHKEYVAGPRLQERKQADVELEEAKKQLVQYVADLDRVLELRKTNTVTQQEVDAVQARHDITAKRIDRLQFAVELMQEGTRQERIHQAKAELGQAIAEELRAKWRLDNCKIRAPISGTILKKNTEEGNIVNAIAFNGSFSVCDVADLSDLEVDLNIQERDISKIHVGQKCDVRAEAYPNRVYHGVVSRLMPIADRAKGAIPVRVKVTVPSSEQGQFLKPDMGALVAFRNGGQK
jgi:HlyD family secretion protein